MKTLDEKIAVMLAYKMGARIERCPYNSFVWVPSDDPRWNWDWCDYRVAEPAVRKPRDFVIMVDEHDKPHGGWVWPAQPTIVNANGCELVRVREVLPTKPNAVDLMVEVLPDGTQRIVMPMYLKDLDDLGRTHSFVRVAS